MGFNLARRWNCLTLPWSACTCVIGTATMGCKSCLTVRLVPSTPVPLLLAPHRTLTDLTQILCRRQYTVRATVAPIAAPVILAIASFRPADPVVGEFRANDDHHLRPLDIGLCMLYPSSGSIAAGIQATIGNITTRMYLQWSRALRWGGQPLRRSPSSYDQAAGTGAVPVEVGR
jgi:hypothetical protein